MKLTLAIAALLAVAAAPRASGQPLPPGSQVYQPPSIDRTGISVGGRLYSAGVSIDLGEFGGDVTSEQGFGAELDLGYGITRTVGVFFNVGGAAINGADGGDDYGLGTADLGLRFNILPSSSFNPFVQVAATGQAAVFDVDGTSENLELRGGGLTLGLGALYRLSDSVDLDFGIDVTGGAFNEFVFDGESESGFDELPSGIARLGVGLVFRP